MIRPFLCLLALAAPAAAQETVPAPDYFVETAMDTSTAQIVAVNCPTLSIDPVAMSQRTEATIAALEADGFTPENLATRMEDPSEAIGVLQNAFRARHGLSDDVTEAAVCAAGKREIAEGTALGELLVEVGE